MFFIETRIIFIVNSLQGTNIVWCGGEHYIHQTLLRNLEREFCSAINIHHALDEKHARTRASKFSKYGDAFCSKEMTLIEWINGRKKPKNPAYDKKEFFFQGMQ